MNLIVPLLLVFVAGRLLDLDFGTDEQNIRMHAAALLYFLAGYLFKDS